MVPTSRQILLDQLQAAAGALDDAATTAENTGMSMATIEIIADCLSDINNLIDDLTPRGD